jgi:hypothetical protein
MGHGVQEGCQAGIGTDFFPLLSYFYGITAFRDNLSPIDCFVHLHASENT